MQTPVLGYTQHNQPACHASHQVAEGGLHHNTALCAGFWDQSSKGSVAGTLRRGLMVRCAHATAWTAATLLATIRTPDIARAQPPAPQVAPRLPDAGHGAPATVGAPSHHEAADALVMVEDWLRAGEVTHIAGMVVPEFSGVAIWVRLEGRVAARASIITAPGEVSKGVLARATRSVLEQIAGTFDPARFPGLEPREWLGATLGGATITMELAGPLVPFRAQSYDDVDLGVSPGVWGVASSVGAGFDAIFPLAMVTNQMTPGSALRSTIAKASGDPRLPLPGVEQGSPGAIEKSHGARFYRFQTAQVTRLSPAQPPVSLHRGGLVYEKARLSHAELVAFADGMARHLVGRLRVGMEEGGTGVELADSRGSGEAQRAPGLLALHALSGYVRVAEESRLRGDVEAMLDNAEDALMAELRVALAAKESGPGPIEAALISTWLSHRPGVYGGSVAQSEAAAAMLAASVRLVYDAGKNEFDAKLPEPARGLVALAMVRLSEWAGSGVSREEAERCVRGTFLAVTPGTLAVQMPWLGWAELELAGEKGAVPSAAALLELRDELYSRTLDPFEAGEDDVDLAGGIVGATGGSVLPTWHTARPGAFLATMLGDARLTPPDTRVRELSRLLGLVRFLRQLAVDDVAALLYPERAEGVRWGLRSALWDLRQPGDATAFGLLAISETLRALEATREGEEGNGKTVPGSP